MIRYRKPMVARAHLARRRPHLECRGVTGRLFATWISPDSAAVMISQSFDGTHWSSAVPVVPSAANRDYINADVAAYRGQVFVASSTRDLSDQDGRYAQQEVSVSPDGVHFDAPIKLGPLSDLR